LIAVSGSVRSVRVFVQRTVVSHAARTEVHPYEGDVIRIHTGNGGDYGDPRRRLREAVLEDIRNGFATDDRAQDVYGVVC
jgi:N-methylhydantoinase B